MLKLPQKLLRILRGGPVDGTKYTLVTTPENYEQGYIVVELAGGDGLIYLFTEKEPFDDAAEDAEVQYFDYSHTLPMDEAREWVKMDSAHRRN